MSSVLVFLSHSVDVLISHNSSAQIIFSLHMQHVYWLLALKHWHRYDCGFYSVRISRSSKVKWWYNYLSL